MGILLGPHQVGSIYLLQFGSIKVSSRVKNHHFSKFAIFRRLNRAHQELSFKKIPGKNVFSVQTYGAQKFFLC